MNRKNLGVLMIYIGALITAIGFMILPTLKVQALQGFRLLWLPTASSASPWTVLLWAIPLLLVVIGIGLILAIRIGYTPEWITATVVGLTIIGLIALAGIYTLLTPSNLDVTFQINVIDIGYWVTGVGVFLTLVGGALKFTEPSELET